VVLADADFERAATAIAYAAMGYAGQKCTATSRVIVEDTAYAKFRDQLTAAVAALGVLDPGQDGTLVGPVITERARDSAVAAVAGSGGTVLTGGTALDAPGFYLAPTLVELDSPAGPLATEEVFAPVAAVLRADSAESAVRIANDVRYGLVTALFTQDLGRALRLADQFDAGMVRVNAPTSGVDFHAPFGGAKQSSYGPREQGIAARDFYTETRTVTIVP
jgi:aldehyde dehydrogenase (NAD+)